MKAKSVKSCRFPGRSFKISIFKGEIAQNRSKSVESSADRPKCRFLKCTKNDQNLVAQIPLGFQQSAAGAAVIARTLFGQAHVSILMIWKGGPFAGAFFGRQNRSKSIKIRRFPGRSVQISIFGRQNRSKSIDFSADSSKYRFLKVKSIKIVQIRGQGHSSKKLLEISFKNRSKSFRFADRGALVKIY